MANNYLIETKFYKINLEFYSYGTDITDKVKSEVSFSFYSLDIYEAIANIPFFKLILNVQSSSSFDDVTDIKLSYISDNEVYSCYLGVMDFVLESYTVTFRGWATLASNFLSSNTRYLGSNSKMALSRLEIRDIINIKTAQTSDIWQINLSNLGQCLSICKSCADTPFWSISMPSINLKEGELNDSYIPRSDEGKLRVIPYNKWDLTSAVTKRFFCEGGDSIYALAPIANKTIMNNNMEITQKSKYETKYMIVNAYNGIFPYSIGERFYNKNNLYPKVKEWVTTSLYRHYEKAKTYTNIQYMSILK